MFQLETILRCDSVTELMVKMVQYSIASVHAGQHNALLGHLVMTRDFDKKSHPILGLFCSLQKMLASF